jgi:MFS family permease
MQQHEILSSDDWPAARLAWTTVGILAVAQFVNALDRYLINLLVEPIKADLGVSDTQMGLLLGLAFAIFYTFLGLPIGRWADTYSRKFIITCGVLFWSFMTMACGLAQSYKQLFLTRMAVGAGEASLNPCGYSLISDYFPSERRATPMGVFIVGATIGSATVLFLGGVLIEYLTVNQITWPLPWGGHLKPWQIAFVLAGLPGFAVALLVRMMREPPRRELIEREVREGEEATSNAQLPIRQVVSYVIHHSRSYAPLFLGFGMVLMWAMGKNLWAPTFMMRSFGWSPSQVGLVMALIIILGNSLGVVSGGYASEWVARRGYKDAHLRTAFCGTLIGLPFAIIAPLVPNPMIAVPLLFPAFFFGAFPFALAPAAIASITPNQMRAQITAFYLLTINLLGFGLGPAFIGFLTDYIFGDPMFVGRSMALSAAICMPIAVVLLWIGMGAFRRTVDELAAHTTH